MEEGELFQLADEILADYGDVVAVKAFEMGGHGSYGVGNAALQLVLQLPGGREAIITRRDDWESKFRPAVAAWQQWTAKHRGHPSGDALGRQSTSPAE